MGKEIKLTEEEIVKALGLCAKDVTCILDYDCPLREDKNCHTTLSKLALELINRQKAEIERLTEERNKYIIELDDVESANDYANKFLHEAKEKNAELQKQVDELTDKLGKVLLGIKADELLVAKGVEQAVKDTAKEIYTQVLEWLPIGEDYSVFIDNIEMWLKERYGVEVE